MSLQRIGTKDHSKRVLIFVCCAERSHHTALAKQITLQPGMPVWLLFGTPSPHGRCVRTADTSFLCMNDHSSDHGDGCSLEGRRRECSGDKMDWVGTGGLGELTRCQGSTQHTSHVSEKKKKKKKTRQED